MASTTSAAAPPLEEHYERLLIDLIHESDQNPRTHFDPTKLDELARSIREKGVIQPIVVRPSGRKGMAFEIVAGARRHRAARAAGLTEIPAIVRAYSDEAVLEVMLVENRQRDDLTALEEAAGYRALIQTDPKKHSAATIAQRLGMSENWVWDRLKLRDLVPEAKALLERGKMAVGHAILVARQTPANQTRLIDPDGDLLFTPLEHGVRDGQTDPKEKPGKYDDVKAVSVRELEAAIAQHIRFDVTQAAKAAPLLFAATEERVRQALAQPGRGKKVIHITFAHQASDDAKDPHERTYGYQSWRRADGTKKTTPVNSWGKAMKDSPTCGFSVLGVVVAGDEHYRETFEVCVNREKCKVHFGQEIAAREKTQKRRTSGGAAATLRREAAAAAREAKDAAARERREARWKYFAGALTKAVEAAAQKTPAALPKGLYLQVLAHQRLPAATKPAQLAKALLLDCLGDVFNHPWHGDEQKLVKWAKALGVDVKACEPPKAAAPAKKAS